MPKSPFRDYTSILQQSRTTKKKQEAYGQTFSFDRRSKQSRFNFNNDLTSTNNRGQIIEDLQMKLQLELKHNNRLLQENSNLSKQCNELRCELRDAVDDITILKRQAEDHIKASAKDRDTLLMENEIKQNTHDQELKRLLDEISTLQEEKNNLEIQRNKETQNLKNQFEKNLVTQMQNIRSVQASTKELYEAQVRNLKETIKKQQFDLENTKAMQKLEKNRLADQIDTMTNEIKHMKQNFEIELKQAKRQFTATVQSEKRRNLQERELQGGSYHLKIKRLKKQLLSKAQDLQMVNKKMFHQEQSNQLQSLNFRKDKQHLLSELTNNQINAKTALMKEKTKLEELSRLQIDNLTQLYQTNIQQLQGEVNRLRLIIDCKTQEIKDIYEENRKIKISYGSENQLLREESIHLKERLKSQQRQFMESQEATKVKLANLIQTNIQQISEYFQHELSNLSIHNKELQTINKDLKERIYKLLQENDELRKKFEIQNSKHKARIQDLKIKLASINLEHKQHIGSLASKVELTSQTIIRDSDNKQRSKAFYDEQKRKFHALANQKDKQITDLMDMIKNIKAMHEDQLKVIRSEKDEFRQQIQKLEFDKQKVKQTLEQELINKQEKLKNLKYDNQKEIEEINALEKKFDEVEKENLKLKKKLDHLTMTSASLAQELGMSKGFIESMQLESSAAIEQEKNKIRVLMGSHEVTLKEYFQDKVKGKDSQIDNLQRTLAEKEEDIRDLIVKYNALEKRLDIMLENQDKLSQFEQKIQHLGLDNSLIKGMAQLFKKK